MNKLESKKMAKEMAAFCKERVKTQKERAESSPTHKLVLNTVIASLLTVPIALDSPHKKSSW